MVIWVMFNFIQSEKFLKPQFRNITINLDMKKMSQQLNGLMPMSFTHKRYTGT